MEISRFSQDFLTIFLGTEGDSSHGQRQTGFSISVFGRFTYTLSALDGHYLRIFWEVISISKVMFDHIRQHVREQPDT